MAGVLTDVQTLISIIQQLYEIKETIESNQTECKRLCDRAKNIEKYLPTQSKPNPNLTPYLFTTLKSLLEEISEFVRKFNDRTRLLFQLTFRSSYSNDIAAFNQRLNQSVLELTLGTVSSVEISNIVDKQRSEDISDIKSSFSFFIESYVKDSASRDSKASRLEEIQNQISQQQEIIIQTLKATGYKNPQLSSSEIEDLILSKKKWESDISICLQVLDNKLDDLANDMKRRQTELLQALDEKTEAGIASAIRELNLSRLRISKDQFEISEVILDQGAFAYVTMAKFKGSPTGYKVAVKVIYRSKTNIKAKDVENECLKMDALSSCSYIIKTYGFDNDSLKSLIFMERAEFGSVWSLVKQGSFPKIPFSVLIYWILNIVQGLEYMHKHHVIHKDIKAQNTLVCDELVVKICDFGLSKDADDSGLTKGTLVGAGTEGFMAPELSISQFNNDRKHASPSTDMFAWAKTAVQILLGKVVLEKVSLSTPLPFPTTISDVEAKKLKTLLVNCASFDPDNRKEANEAKEILQAFIAANFKSIEVTTDFSSTIQTLRNTKLNTNYSSIASEVTSSAASVSTSVISSTQSSIRSLKSLSSLEVSYLLANKELNPSLVKLFFDKKITGRILDSVVLGQYDLKNDSKLDVLSYFESEKRMQIDFYDLLAELHKDGVLLSDIIANSIVQSSSQFEPASQNKNNSIENQSLDSQVSESVQIPQTSNNLMSGTMNSNGLSSTALSDLTPEEVSSLLLYRDFPVVLVDAMFKANVAGTGLELLTSSSEFLDYEIDLSKYVSKGKEKELLTVLNKLRERGSVDNDILAKAAETKRIADAKRSVENLEKLTETGTITSSTVKSKVNRGNELRLAAKAGNISEIVNILDSSETPVDDIDENDTKSYDEGGTCCATALILASWDGHEACVRLLLDRNASIEARDHLMNTPLIRAAHKGHEKVVALLIDKGANIEARDKYGYSPLIWAAYNGHEKVVSLLIDKGASIEARDNYGNTPLIWAVLNRNADCVKMLLARGASKSARDKVGKTALDYAIEKGYGDIKALFS